MILVGIIPDPHEPQLTINSYFQPLVTELNLLCKDGITVTALEALISEVYHANLSVLDAMYQKYEEVCGSTGHLKCTKNFPGTVTTRIDFLGFDLPSPSS